MTFKKLMKESDMTAARLARILGVSDQTVSNWVKGRTVPNTLQLLEISRQLHKPIHIIANSFSVIGSGGKKR